MDATIVLRADLRETLEKDAEQEARSLDDMVNEAVEHYLRERQRAKLDQELSMIISRLQSPFDKSNSI